MRILVVAAHPDDEVLGCGGTILQDCRFAKQIYVTFLYSMLTLPIQT